MTTGQIILNGDFDHPIQYDGMPVKSDIYSPSLLAILDGKVFNFYIHGEDWCSEVGYNILETALFIPSNIVAIITL